MRKGDMIFVYGTLRKGESADLSQKMMVDHIGEDQINGEMFDLGRYPGAKVTAGSFNPGEPFIQGDVFLIRDASITDILDAYEGYPSLYGRLETETASGRIVWVYVYNHEVSDEQRVESGDWRAHTATRRRRA